MFMPNRGLLLLLLLTVLATAAHALDVASSPLPLVASNGVSVRIVGSLPGVRTIARDSAGDLLALAVPQPGGVGPGGIFLLRRRRRSDDDENLLTATRLLDSSALGLALTHSLAHHDGHVYASDPDNVYRWPYVAGSGAAIDDARREVVVRDINKLDGGAYGHVSRTIAIDDEGVFMYVSIGSRTNVDGDSRAARVRRFRVPPATAAAPGSFPGYSYTEDGELWADGTRNSVALNFDAFGRIWSAENGADNMSRNDLVDAEPDPSIPNFHNDSPVEELNLLDDPTVFLGYPYCFTSGNTSTSFSDDASVGRQWAWPTFMRDGTHDDAWCRNASNNRPPTASLPAHSAPIELRFLRDGDGCGLTERSVPCELKGNVFLTLHGSWNRDIPTGFSVVMLGMDVKTGLLQSAQRLTTLVAARDLANLCKGRDSMRCFRPAGMAFSREGTLIVGSDATGDIAEIGFEGWRYASATTEGGHSTMVCQGDGCQDGFHL